ncbi:hypothetical protein ACE6H2_010060 [Prunus campanulata]
MLFVIELEELNSAIHLCRHRIEPLLLQRHHITANVSFRVDRVLKITSTYAALEPLNYLLEETNEKGSIL